MKLLFKFPWRVFAVLMGLTFAVVGWLFIELGVMDSHSLQAQEKPSSVAPSPSTSQIDKEKELADRERAIEEKEKFLTQQLEKYEKTFKELKAQIAQLEAQQNETDGETKRLYEKMEPKKAAKILDVMEPTQAASVLSSLIPNRAAEILGLMSVEKAKILTEKLLHKRSLAKDR